MSWQKPEILEVCRLEVHIVKLILKCGFKLLVQQDY